MKKNLRKYDITCMFLQACDFFLAGVRTQLFWASLRRWVWAGVAVPPAVQNSTQIQSFSAMASCWFVDHRKNDWCSSRQHRCLSLWRDDLDSVAAKLYMDSGIKNKASSYSRAPAQRIHSEQALLCSRESAGPTAASLAERATDRPFRPSRRWPRARNSVYMGFVMGRKGTCWSCLWSESRAA